MYGSDALQAGGDIGQLLASALYDQLKGKGFEVDSPGTLTKPLTGKLGVGGRLDGDDAIGTVTIQFEIGRPVGPRGASVTMGAGVEIDAVKTNVPIWEDWNDLPDSRRDFRGDNDLFRQAIAGYNEALERHRRLNSANDWINELCDQLNSQPAAKVKLNMTINTNRNLQLQGSMEIDPDTGNVTSTLGGVLKTP